jgi:hypothetical protein
MFRVLKKRLAEIPTSTDLRGLDDPALFGDSKLVVHLLASGIGDGALAPVCARYGLSCEPSNDVPHGFRVSLRHPGAGEHKKQALALFFAALELHRSVPGIRCLIHQRNGVRAALVHRIEGAHPGASEEARTIREWKSEMAPLAIDAPVSAYLHQAGIAIAPAGKLTRLDENEISRLHADLVARHEDIQRRKVG